MAITLASDEYDEIRLLIGGDIDEEDLPDARINGGTVIGRGRIVCAAADTGRSEWVEHYGSTCLSASDTVSVRVDFGTIIP